jgi:hypothetical protein
MARTTEIPGLFGGDTQFAPRLAETFGLDISGFSQPTQAMVGGFVDPFPELSNIELAKKFNLSPQDRTREQLLKLASRTGQVGRIGQAALQQQGLPTPAETLGLSAAEQIAAPSIFEQLGIPEFAQRLTQPQGFERTPEQEALIQELIGITGGATAVRGLGAPTAGAIASQIAPTLAGFRQQNIQNQLATLMGLTGAAGVGGGERLGEIQSLLDLTGLTMPTPIVETGGRGDSTIRDIASLIGGFGSLAALCHVAEELFGEFDMRTHFARFYCATHDNWFVRTYRKMSKIWAKHLNDNPDLKPIVQPIWENMAYLGYERYLKWQEDLHQ